MEKDFWDTRWAEGRIGFHQGAVNPQLAAHGGRLLGSPGSGGRALVPLCGKSLDLDWLAERCAEVVGVEFVEAAVEAFFSERGLTPVREARAAGVRYSAGNVALWAADFFALTAADVGPVEVFYDRAAMIALPPELRARYPAQLASLVPAGARGLLVTLVYPPGALEGPPFSVDDEEVEARFSADFALERLERVPATTPVEGLEGASSVWLLERRG